MFRFLLPLMVFTTFSIAVSAQILDSIRFKKSKRDTILFVTQKDVDDYVQFRKITDTIGKLDGYLRIIKNTKMILSGSGPMMTYERVLQFTEQNEKFQSIYKSPITPADVSEYLIIRKISGDTVGKTSDYIKIIRSARQRVAQGEYMMGLYKKIDYETALIEVEENLKLRSMVDKVLVVKSARKLYLQKDGKTIKTYAISLGPNPVGQKEYEGDGKTPEGVYALDYQKWETSTFHSFHISYPNEKDLARAKAKGVTAGSFIMIHGTSKGVKKKKDWTNGCIALNNTDMAEFKKMVFLNTPVEIRK